MESQWPQLAGHVARPHSLGVFNLVLVVAMGREVRGARVGWEIRGFWGSRLSEFESLPGAL